MVSNSPIRSLRRLASRAMRPRLLSASGPGLSDMVAASQLTHHGARWKQQALGREAGLARSAATDLEEEAERIAPRIRTSEAPDGRGVPGARRRRERRARAASRGGRRDN